MEVSPPPHGGGYEKSRPPRRLPPHCEHERVVGGAQRLHVGERRRVVGEGIIQRRHGVAVGGGIRRRIADADRVLQP